MYCPQCGTETQAKPYCRVCGANLKALEKPSESGRPLISFGRKKTPAEKREDHLSKGVVSLTSGIGLGIFLYFLSAALVLKLPPEVVAQIPFEIYPVVKVIWLIGLLPVTSGIGHIIAGLLIRPRPEAAEQLDQASEPPALNPKPVSVIEHTTNLLEQERIKL
jgi:hypothetical protein